MILDKMTTFDEFFGDKHVQRDKHGRAAYFFQDMQRTLDEPDMENIQIGLIVLYNILYGEKDTTLQEDQVIHLIRRYERANSEQDPIDVQQLPEIFEKIIREEWNRAYKEELDYADRQYQERIKILTDQFNKYRTLIYAEKQQKAFERQLEINKKLPPSILPELSEADFLAFSEELYEAKVKYGFNGLGKSACVTGYKELYDACKVQPIAAAFLPVILTVFSTDEKKFSNLYSYFKYKNRRLTAEAQERVISLFKSISGSVEKWARGFELPVFRWDDIEYRFCEYNGLSSEEFRAAKEYFAQYRSKNGFSKSQESALLELPYGANLRALAKLCNLNTYMMMNYMPPESSPNKAKKPYEQLLNGNLLPKIIKTRDDFRAYFCELYITVPCNPAFCYLALLRYYHILPDLEIDFMPGDLHQHEFFHILKDNLIKILKKFCTQIRVNYEIDPNPVLHISAQEPVWIQKRKEARLAYTWDFAEKQDPHRNTANEFSRKIRFYFKKEDYAEFIDDVKNFQLYYFSWYLNCFCEKYKISEYADMDAMGKCYLEDIAFPVILNLVQNTLLNNVEKFWQEKIAEELFRKE